MTTCGDKDKNWDQLESLVNEAVNKDAKFVFLPECCDYIASNRHESLALSETLAGPFVTKLKNLAKTKGVWLSAGGIHIKQPSASHLANTHLLINSDGRIVGNYVKTHLFSYALPGASLNEGGYVKAGDSVEAPVATPAGNVGLAICYDLRFPELSQVLRRQGAQLLTFPSAFTVKTGEAHWETLLRARAIETQCYVVAAAQVGNHNEKRSSYGHAMIVDPWGRVVSELPDSPGVATAEIDLDLLVKVRREMPCISHSRQDLFPISLPPQHHTPQLLHLQALPLPTDSYQFGPLTVLGGAVFLSTSLSYAFSNLYPKVPGHSLVSPRRVVARFSDLSPAELSDLLQLAVVAHRLLAARHGCGHCQVAIQDGPQSGQSVQHVHVHLLPHASTASFSPDVTPNPTATKAEDGQVAMVTAATELRAAMTPALAHGNEEQTSANIPEPFELEFSDGEEYPGNIPPAAVCLRSKKTFAYCTGGTFQKCHIIVQPKRAVATLSQVLPSEAYEMLANAQHLQQLLQKVTPGLSTTLVIMPKSQHFESVHLHLIPWFAESKDPDAVYSYVASYKRHFSEAEGTLAAAFLKADESALRSLLYP